MSGAWGHMVGVLIVILMLVFVGIWFWAWRPKHKATFDALARIPMSEARNPPGPADSPADGDRRPPGAGNEKS